MRLMSVAITTAAVRDRTKTVTRRNGWAYLKTGDLLELCAKVQGRKPGEPLDRICQVRVTEISREPLSDITEPEVVLEGFPNMTPAEFIDMFCDSHKGVEPSSVITRIRWEYL